MRDVIASDQHREMIRISGNKPKTNSLLCEQRNLEVGIWLNIEGSIDNFKTAEELIKSYKFYILVSDKPMSIHCCYHYSKMVSEKRLSIKRCLRNNLIYAYSNEVKNASPFKSGEIDFAREALLSSYL